MVRTERRKLMAASVGGIILLLPLIIAAIIDMRYFIIPNSLSFIIFITGIGFSYVTGTPAFWVSISGILCGTGSLLLICSVFRLLRGYDGMGMGDVKLLGASGAWIGWYGIAPVLFISSVAALIFAIATDVSFDAHRRVAFAPFLGVAIFSIWLLQTVQLAPWMPS